MEGNLSMAASEHEQDTVESAHRSESNLSSVRTKWKNPDRLPPVRSPRSDDLRKKILETARPQQSIKCEMHGDLALAFLRIKRRSRDQAQLVTVLMDSTDLALFEGFNGSWHVIKNETSFYVQGVTAGRVGEQQRVSLHRHLLNPPSNKVVDHINGNGLDNRRSNLRVVTAGTNKVNAVAGNKRNQSGFRGVDLTSWGVWRANFTYRNEIYILGYYYDARIAAQVAERGRMLIEAGRQVELPAMLRRVSKYRRSFLEDVGEPIFKSS